MQDIRRQHFEKDDGASLRENLDLTILNDIEIALDDFLLACEFDLCVI